MAAGAATECAAEQNMFWEYHDALFEESNFRLDSHDWSIHHLNLARMAMALGGVDEQ